VEERRELGIGLGFEVLLSLSFSVFISLYHHCQHYYQFPTIYCKKLPGHLLSIDSMLLM
jgi:hypothetical protein